MARPSALHLVMLEGREEEEISDLQYDVRGLVIGVRNRACMPF